MDPRAIVKVARQTANLVRRRRIDNLTAVIVGDNGDGTYRVRTIDTVDPDDEEVEYKSVSPLTSTNFVVGDTVLIGRMSRYNEQVVILSVGTGRHIIADGEPPTPTITDPWWGRHRFSMRRSSTAISTGALSPFYPPASQWVIWKVSSKRTDILRAGKDFVYQVGISDGYNRVWTWPFRSPRDPAGNPLSHDPTQIAQLDNNDNQMTIHAWIDSETGIWLARGGYFELWTPGGFSGTKSGYNGAILAEPLRVTNGTASALLNLAVTNYNPGQNTMRWTFTRWVVPTFTASDHNVDFPLWRSATALPSRDSAVSEPIYSWEDYDSPIFEPGFDVNRWMADPTGATIICHTDAALLTFYFNQRDAILAGRTDADYNVAHIYSRGQLRCVNETGGTVWEKNYWQNTADLGVTAPGYGGITPTLIAGNNVYSHFVAHKFETKAMRFVTFNATAASEIPELVKTDKKAFANYDWDSTTPAPPWVWRRNYIDQRISAYLAQYEPSLTPPVNRDIQTQHIDGLIAHTLANGAVTAKYQCPTHATPRYITLDRGDPGKEPYTTNESRRFVKAIVRRDGVATSSSQTLRQILNLTDDEQCLLFFAVETFTGTEWTGYDFSYTYYFGTDFDSRTDESPAWDKRTEPWTQTTVPPPYWENEQDENGLRNMYPFGDYSSGNPYQIFGNQRTGYHTIGQVSTFYTAHGRYCLTIGLRNEIVFLEPTIGWIDYTDPTGNFNHHTTQIQYYAYVVQYDNVAVTGSDPNRGWSAYNAVYDGANYLYFLPRRAAEYTPGGVRPENEPPRPDPANLPRQVLRIKTDLTSPQVITFPVNTPMAASPVGFAYTANDVALNASILWLWTPGNITKIVNGSIMFSSTIADTSSWTSATMFYADGSIWLSGTGPGSCVFKIDRISTG